MHWRREHGCEEEFYVRNIEANAHMIEDSGSKSKRSNHVGSSKDIGKENDAKWYSAIPTLKEQLYDVQKSCLHLCCKRWNPF